MKKISALAAVFVAASASPSIAADAKVIPGLACQNTYPETYQGLGTYLFRSGGGVFNNNNNGEGRILSCPLVRDNTGNTNGMQDLEVSVNASTTALWCQAISSTRFGSGVKSVLKYTPGTGNQVIDFNAEVDASSAKGLYWALCVIPEDSWIMSVYLDEY